MKKLLSTILLLVAGIGFLGYGINKTIAADTTATVSTTNWDADASLKRVNTIGTKLMTASKLPSGITFKVSAEEDINAYANLNKEVYVYKGLLQYVSDDNELAAVIAHELGHIINGHCAKQTVVNTALSAAGSLIQTDKAMVSSAVGGAQQLTSTKLSRTDEYEADLTGADLLAKAGYNPLAMVSVLNKICGNYMDILSTHPSGEKRLYNIYDYVDYNYSTYTKSGYNSESYKQAAVLIKPYVEKRTATASKIAKFKKEQEKLKVKKAKREAKVAKSGSSPWEMSVNALQMFAK